MLETVKRIGEALGWIPNKAWQLEHPLELHPEYALAFVEFDDQGWFYDPSQVLALFHYLASLADTHVVIKVFIHGWKHNASEHDLNVCSFKALLQDTYRSEMARSGAQRRIVGVYVGWRGAQLSLPVIEEATFWTRKSAALRVALGSTRELLARLRRFQRDKNGANQDDPNGTRLILLGHSFGGLILFSAVAEYLMESAARSDERIVKPFGDLVILINPAFEATRYWPVYSVISGRKFREWQRSAFLAITAENDRATGWAFPLGRYVSTALESHRTQEQRKANVNTMGHMPKLKTHHLSANEHGRSRERQKHHYEAPRVTPDQIMEEGEEFRAFNRQYRPEGHLQNGWKRTYTAGAVLQHVAEDPDIPYWVVSATSDVVNGHNGIFKHVFLDFIRQLVDDRLREAHHETLANAG